MLTSLKRLLRPVKPFLHPIWQRIQPYVERPPRPAIRRSLSVRLRIMRDRTVALVRRQQAPIRPLRESEFNAMARTIPYYTGRWGYMSAACTLVGDLIDTYRLTTALELGPHIQPVVVGADLMDRMFKADLTTARPILIHDARNVPWPIADKQYDLFVALQVFEHLGSSQREAFAEVCRIARHAVISVPIDWQMADPSNCHHQISQATALSWFLPIIPTRVELGNGGSRKRVIYVFEDLPASIVAPARASERHGPGQVA